MSAPRDTASRQKTPRASRISISQLMQPEHGNLNGDVHGGWIMKLADEAGALAAMRHAQSRVVTVAIDQMCFHHPIRIGDLVTLQAEVTYVGRTSMETHVQVTAENPITGRQSHTHSAYLVYVALDKHGRPCPVPKLEPETEAEVLNLRDGERRQAYRLTQRDCGSPEVRP